ncbi:AraC family transcriptional regulator [Paenibacillus qinlingensis]|uniref:AraC-like DNA-binding protein n=1 Tax=Paenibacillus qinlingensis TaxID=1837343 RepID=A0ABU1NR77_9BACL|nr:AraC family transcriptional regulator [Paenibacillus qinlingensis]MDR6549959.1 AraC-like DNA-binding protein [Paenibacillus qinlingensis]
MYKLISIGHSSVSDENYRWDGLKRGGQGIIFQYTLKGAGKLRIGNEGYTVPKGHAFIVAIPSDHEYAFDASSGEPWEFIWIRFEGVKEDWLRHDLLQPYGPVLELESDTAPIHLLWRLYTDTAENKLNDRFDLSLRIYEWLLALQRCFIEGGAPSQLDIPPPYKRVAAYIQKHLAEDLTLDQLADIAELDKYYLCKMFPLYYRVTPMDYVRNRRIEQAAELLRDPGLSITVIAALCGYSSLSYFGKVFHKMVGMSPLAFRHSEISESDDYLRFLE